MSTLPRIHNEVAVPAESFVQFNGYFKEGMVKPDTYSKWAKRGKLITEKACKGKKAIVMYKTIPSDKRKLVWEYFFDTNKDALFEIPDVPEGWLRQIFPNFEEKREEIMQNNKKELDYLSDKELEIAQCRYNIVKYMKEYVGDGKYGSALKNREEFVDRYNQQLIHEHIFKVLGATSLKTIYRWSLILKKEGNDINMEVLAPSYRTSAINRSRTTMTEEEIKLCKQLWTLANKPSISSVARKVTKELENRGRTDICSEFQIRRFLNQWAKNNSITVTYIREGEKALKDTLLPHIERDNKKLNFMDMIVADGHTLNFQIKNPKTGFAVRPTVITWVDMRTLMVLGWEVMLTENTKSVVSAFRNAMLNAAKLLGMEGKAIVPKITYTDNGKAFKNKYFKGKNKETSAWHEEFDGLFNRLKPYGFIQSIYALPYEAQTKVNERIFGTMLEYEKMQVSYVGNNIGNKPARMHRNEKMHTKEYDKIIEKQGLPTLQEVYIGLGKWFGEYNQRASSGKYLNGNSPLQEMLTCYEEAEKRTIDIDSLHYMMLESKDVNLQKQGIKFMGNWYNCLLLSNMERGSEWGLKIKYDLMNLESIRVYRDNGEFLCEAERMYNNIHPAAELLGSEADKENYQRALQQKGEYKKYAKQIVNEFINDRGDNIKTLNPYHEVSAIEQEEVLSIEQPKKPKTKAEEEDYDFHNTDRPNPVLDNLLLDILDTEE